MKQPHIWGILFILCACVSSVAFAADAGTPVTPPEKIVEKPPEQKRVCPSPELVAKIKTAALEIITGIGRDDPPLSAEKQPGMRNPVARQNDSHKMELLTGLFAALMDMGDVNGAKEIYTEVLKIKPGIGTIGDEQNLNDRAREAARGRWTDPDKTFYFTDALQGRQAAFAALAQEPKAIRLRILSDYAKRKIRESDFIGAWEFVELIKQDQALPYYEKEFFERQRCNYEIPKHNAYEDALFDVGGQFAMKGALKEAQLIAESVSPKQSITLLKRVLDKQMTAKDKTAAAETFNKLMAKIEKTYEGQPKDSRDYLDDKIEALTYAGNYKSAMTEIQNIGDRYVQDMNGLQGRHCYTIGALGGVSLSEGPPPPVDHDANYYKDSKYDRIMANALDKGRFDAAEMIARTHNTKWNRYNFAEEAAAKDDFEKALAYYRAMPPQSASPSDDVAVNKMYHGPCGNSVPSRLFVKFISKGKFKEAQEFVPAMEKRCVDDMINAQTVGAINKRDADLARTMITPYLEIQTGKDGLVQYRKLAVMFIAKGFMDEVKQVHVAALKKIETMRDWEQTDALQDLRLIEQAIGDTEALKITEQRIAKAKPIVLKHVQTHPPQPRPDTSVGLWSDQENSERLIVSELRYGNYEKAEELEKSLAIEHQRNLTIQRFKNDKTKKIPNMPELYAMEKDPSYDMSAGKAYARKFTELAQYMVIAERRVDRGDMAGVIMLQPTLLSYDVTNKYMYDNLMKAEIKTGYIKEATELSDLAHDDFERAKFLVESLKCQTVSDEP